VSEIPLNLQAKLLRVLQEREFERVGGNRTIKVNVRILATSNRDLLSTVDKGSFRQDLYYRLNVFPVHVPALRERPEDILPLAEHFLTRCARKMGVKVAGFSESAIKAMLSYRWPGNVRELQNTIERAVILTENGWLISSAALGLPMVAGEAAGEALLASAMPNYDQSDGSKQAAFDASFATSVSEGPAGAAPGQNGSVFNIAELEKQAIKAALVQTAGNRTKAADLLGISIRTLRNKLQEYRDAGDPFEVGAEVAE
jgi:DNA-binding NtrC family response regulator